MKRLAMGAFLILLAACAGTAESKDWQTRIGHYSVDDAKRELGHPESCVSLDDGGTACSWATKSRDGTDKLVLTFGPNGKLATFNNVHF